MNLRLPILLLALLALSVFAEVCDAPPNVTVIPNVTVGRAGTVRTYVLNITNPNRLVVCPDSFYVNVTLPVGLRKFSPDVYPVIIPVRPQNGSSNFTCSFSSINNASDGNYTITFKVNGSTLLGTPLLTTATAIYSVSERVFDQSDLVVTAYGYRCFDRTNVPRTQCFLYDSFSLDNVTINNTGSGDFRGEIVFRAKITGSNLSHEFAEVNVPPVPRNSSVTVTIEDARTSFAIAGAHEVTGTVITDRSQNESSEANNVRVLSLLVSSGYPPGCVYDNPSCGAGYYCKDNLCVPVIEPTPSATPYPTEEANASATPTPVPTLNASDILNYTDELRGSGENTSEVDILLNQSEELRRQGRFAEAQKLLDEARAKVQALVAKTRASKSMYYIYIGVGFLVLLVAAIVLLVVRKRRREEKARETQGGKKPSVLMPPLTPESFEKRFVPPKPSAPPQTPEPRHEEHEAVLSDHPPISLPPVRKVQDDGSGVRKSGDSSGSGQDTQGSA
ncbi:MAG: hypothetical protein V1787_01075 [Candidatus Micrarchaeota archaeon]